MVEKRKTFKKKIKEPDEFISFTTRAFNFFVKNKKLFLITGTVAILIVAVFMIWYFISKSYEQRSNEMLTKAMGDYSSSVTNFSKDKLRSAILGFEEIVKKYPRTNAASISLLYLGNSYFRIGDYSKAINYYERLREKTILDRRLKALANEGLGIVYEIKGDFQRAIDYYREVSEGGINPLKKLVLIDIGRAYEKAGNVSKAIENYEKFLVSYPDVASNYIFIIKDKVEKLKARKP